MRTRVVRRGCGCLGCLSWLLPFLAVVVVVALLA
jgi:hypothetical protein